MTPAQLKAARGLLGWGIQKLAARSNTTYHLVNTYERSGRVAGNYGRMGPADPMLAVTTTLEEAGVMFVDETGDGPGVRLRKTTS